MRNWNESGTGIKTASFTSVPGRIYGRKHGRKFFHMGAWRWKMRNWNKSGTGIKTASFTSMPGRIYGRKHGRKFFHMGGMEVKDAELE